MKDAIQKYVELNTAEPQKTFMKIGLTCANGFPTEEGVKIILAYWLQKEADVNSDFYKTVATPLLAAKNDEEAK